MGFFDVVGKINPIKGAIFGGGKSHRPGKKWIEKQENRARQEELDVAMKDYENIPQTLTSTYTDEAKRAGTYGNTPEFLSGLQSEVEAGARGARIASLARINSLRKAMGQDAYAPEGVGQTQANMTEDQLAGINSKPLNEAPTVTTDMGDVAPKVKNSTTSVQSIKPKKQPKTTRQTSLHNTLYKE